MLGNNQNVKNLKYLGGQNINIRATKAITLRAFILVVMKKIIYQ